MITRAAIRRPFDDVAAWAAEQPGRCLVTDGGDDWIICDLDGPTGEQLAAALGSDVYEADEWNVWQVDASGATELLPDWVDDPEDPHEVAAFEALWEPIPDLLTGAEPRLAAPLATQTMVMPTPAEEDLQAALTGMALPITVVALYGWTVVAAADEDLVVIAAGLTVTRTSWALVLSTGGGLAGLSVVRRGRVRAEHVWNRRSELVDTTQQDSTWRGQFPASVDAVELSDLIGTPEARTNVTLIRAVMRREGAPDVLLDELIQHLGLRAAGRVACDVLAGQPLAAHPQARRIEPPASFRQFLRASAAGAFLDPDEVPWFSILCAVIFFPLAGNLLYRSFQLMTGSLDGWGTAQLIAAVINTPFAYMYLRRVLRWRAMRRPR